MATEPFVALAQFYLTPDRVVKIGEEFDFDARELREMGSLCGPSPQAVRKGDPRVADAIKAEKTRLKRLASIVTPDQMRERLESVERKVASAG